VSRGRVRLKYQYKQQPLNDIKQHKGPSELLLIITITFIKHLT